ncbi:unnamed protein product [Brassica oleracea]|uniref:ACT-like domain-containing protein n=1 Tax=Brassica oleracea TaxID=3712 RepID=A0A3P6ET62_BRAOL|nr:unnamed protein product [Brassica oleracea]
MDLVRDHMCYLFTFPERPGALMNFLDSFSPRWNISLYHAEGGADANVLVGIHVPEQKKKWWSSETELKF